MFYGLTRGTQTYRFAPNYVFNVEGLTTGNTGDSYELYSDEQTNHYVKAIAVQLNPTQLQIIIQGDYIVDTETFNIVNMRTGVVVNATLSSALTLQDASYLGSFSAVDNKEKQITVLYDLASGKENVVFASLDYNSDGVYNWKSIGNFVNGIDGRSIFGLTASTASGVFAVAKVNDLLVSGEDFTYGGHDYKIGDLDRINTLDPITLVSKGNIRGATGLQGIQGNTGANGTDGLTPYIGSNGNWWIGDTDTTVMAKAENGVDGVDGQAFNIQSGLYSVPANVGNPNNLDPNGNTLTTLPTLPQTDVSGKGYTVYDPITTPLEPYYDLYWANDGDTTWTIIHPFSGIKGQDGIDGYTPYIQNNVWYINGISTGVQATGNTGAIGATPNISVSATDLPAGSTPTATRSGTDANPTITFGIPTGATGDTGATGETGATPNISVNAEELPIGSAPTATRSGTNENLIITFGIPKNISINKIYTSGGDVSKTTLEENNMYYKVGWRYKTTLTLTTATPLEYGSFIFGTIQGSFNLIITSFWGYNTIYYYAANNKTPLGINGTCYGALDYPKRIDNCLVCFNISEGNLLTVDVYHKLNTEFSFTRMEINQLIIS